MTLLQAVGAQEPVLLIVEDLHWADASTPELLTPLVDRAQAMRRIAADAPARVSGAVGAAGAQHCTDAGPAGGRRWRPATQVAGQGAAGVESSRFGPTDGVPPFVEEVTQTALEPGLLAEREAAYALRGRRRPLRFPPRCRRRRGPAGESGGSGAAGGAGSGGVGAGGDEAQLQATVGLERGRLERARRLVAADIVHELSLPLRLTYVFRMP